MDVLPMTAIRVLLVDDHDLVRAGFRALLGKLRYQVVAEASNADDALRLIGIHKPDVVLMDIALSGRSGLEVTEQVTEQYPMVRVVILSMHASPEYARRALRAGAAGYLLKNAKEAELDMAITAATEGETYLSPAVARFIAADYVRRKGAGPEPKSLESLTPRQLEDPAVDRGRLHPKTGSGKADHQREDVRHLPGAVDEAPGHTRYSRTGPLCRSKGIGNARGLKGPSRLYLAYCSYFLPGRTTVGISLRPFVTRGKPCLAHFGNLPTKYR